MLVDDVPQLLLCISQTVIKSLGQLLLPLFKSQLYNLKFGFIVFLKLLYLFLAWLRTIIVYLSILIFC